MVFSSFKRRNSIPPSKSLLSKNRTIKCRSLLVISGEICKYSVSIHLDTLKKTLPRLIIRIMHLFIFCSVQRLIISDNILQVRIFFFSYIPQTESNRKNIHYEFNKAFFPCTVKTLVILLAKMIYWRPSILFLYWNVIIFILCLL